LRQNQQLTAVASAFLFLQEQREAADYDHDADFTRASTLALVLRARSAVGHISAAKETADFRSFLGLISLQTSLRR
jgi:hypothetical protein